MTREDDEMVDRLRSMPRDIPPPPALEARITDLLAGDGLIRRAAPTADHPVGTTHWHWKALAVAATIVLAFLTGLRVGGRAPAGPGTQPRYLLLLYAGAQPAASSSDDIETYRRWARDLRARGRHVSGERLASHPVSLEEPRAAGGEDLEGYFVIDAASDAEALGIAATHPHLRGGGRIVVRRIEPT